MSSSATASSAVTREQSLVERVGGLTSSSRAGAFLQANIDVARKVYERVLTLAPIRSPRHIAVDLYCGVGAISFYLAGRARQVFGVEESPHAILDAKMNIRLNGYHNVRFFGAAAAAGMAQLTEALPGIDLVTLNPPRKGADEATRAAIARAAPSRIVYVSCDPTTLARDLDWFADTGLAHAAASSRSTCCRRPSTWSAWRCWIGSAEVLTC